MWGGHVSKRTLSTLPLRPPDFVPSGSHCSLLHHGIAHARQARRLVHSTEMAWWPWFIYGTVNYECLLGCASCRSACVFQVFLSEYRAPFGLCVRPVCVMRVAAAALLLALCCQAPLRGGGGVHAAASSAFRAPAEAALHQARMQAARPPRAHFTLSAWNHCPSAQVSRDPTALEDSFAALPAHLQQSWASSAPQQTVEELLAGALCVLACSQRVTLTHSLDAMLLFQSSPSLWR